ncbi:Retinoblastoma-related protein 1 [Orobanche hederae]
METQDGNGSSRGVGDQTNLIEVRLAEFCEHCLSLDEKMVEQAVKVLKETKHLLLTNLAVLGGVSRRDWENYLEVVYKWEAPLITAKELQANFDLVLSLKRSYDRVYKEFFLTHDANEKQPRAASQAVHTLDYHCFGWLLFLGLRIHAFSRKDLVTCINDLISNLAILILHMPVRFRNFSLIDSQLFVKRGDKGIDVLASLCNKYDASGEEVKKTMDMINNLIASILKKKPKPAAECNRENLLGIDTGLFAESYTDCLVYFEDLMDESSFGSSLCAFKDSIRGSKSLPGVGVNTADTMRNLDMAMTPKKTITSPPSPYQFPMPPTNGVAGSICKITSTPGTFAMTTSKWLQTTISPHLSGPSARLELFLASYDKDVTNDVKRRAEIILKAIFPSWPLGEHRATGSSQSTNLMENIWAEQRRKEALKLYYRVLEAMFLERTGITAFDLVKGIESFIGHEESLPTELLRHMNSLEERLLESTVW